MKIMYAQMMYLDLNCTTQLNQTALMLAAAKGNIELVTFLINAGADIHHEDKHGENALSLSIWKGYREIAVILYILGSRINEEV